MKAGDMVLIRREENGGFSTGDMRKMFGGQIGQIKGGSDEGSFTVDIPGTVCYFFSWSPKDLIEARAKMS